MSNFGPREQQLRALREKKAAQRARRSTTPPAVPAPSKENAMLKIAAVQGTVAVGDAVTYPDGSRAKVVGVARRPRKAAKKSAKKDSRIKAPKKPKPAKKAAKKSAAREADLRPGSKLAIIDQMLRHPGGCTRAEVMKACHWPSVSMQQQASALGVELKSSKEKGEPTRYWVD